MKSIASMTANETAHMPTNAAAMRWFSAVFAPRKGFDFPTFDAGYLALPFHRDPFRA